MKVCARGTNCNDLEYCVLTFLFICSIYRCLRLKRYRTPLISIPRTSTLLAAVISTLRKQRQTIANCTIRSSNRWNRSTNRYLSYQHRCRHHLLRTSRFRWICRAQARLALLRSIQVEEHLPILSQHWTWATRITTIAMSCDQAIFDVSGIWRKSWTTSTWLFTTSGPICAKMARPRHRVIHFPDRTVLASQQRGARECGRTSTSKWR